MIQFTLNLLEDMDTPVIEIPEMKNATALVDSGARIPVWHGREEDLVAFGAEIKQKDIHVKGLCGGDNKGNLYKLTNFQLGKLLFVELDIAVLPDMAASYNMILSSSMFRHTIYEIDDINHRFNVSVEENDYVRRLIAYYDEKQGRLYVHYNE